MSPMMPSLTGPAWRWLTALIAVIVLATSVAQGRAQDRGAAQEDVEARARLYRTIIRFATDSDYPPFNYLDDEGTLTGFNVDMARAICLELDVSCDVQAKDWGDLLALLKRGEVDAVIASLAITPKLLAEADVTDRYYFTPGRFAARKDRHKEIQVTPVGLEAKRVGVVRGTVHEAYIAAFFRDCILQTFASAELAREALQEGKVDLVFDDGISLALWLNGSSSKGCCDMRGGPFGEPAYFGDGVGIVIRKGDRELMRLVNGAIRRVRESGQYLELVKRYFPAAYAGELERN